MQAREKARRLEGGLASGRASRVERALREKKIALSLAISERRQSRGAAQVGCFADDLFAPIWPAHCSRLAVHSLARSLAGFLASLCHLAGRGGARNEPNEQSRRAPVEQGAGLRLASPRAASLRAARLSVCVRHLLSRPQAGSELARASQPPLYNCQMTHSGAQWHSRQQTGRAA